MKNNKALAFLALVFVALFSYWTFEQIKYYRDKDSDKSFENLPDTLSDFTENLSDETEEGPVTTGPVTDTSDQQVAGATTWTATDYKQGDISKGSYKVKSGDTLWEIAEAVYGDGTQWVNILNANSGSIGYLPGGQQALIFPDQMLQIP